MKYKEIIKIIKNISLALPDVQSFYTGDVYEVNADQSVKYSSVVLTNQEHQFDNINDKFQYNFILFYIDRLTDDEANRTDIHTAAVSALKAIVRHLEDYNVIINDFKFNLFRERFNDSCAGAYASLSVDVEDNDCNEDFDFTYGQISADKLKEISITTNGTYTPDEGYYYTKIDVNVQPQLQNKSVNINENGQRTVEADSDYDGLGSVDINVNIPTTEPKLGSLIATENDYWYIASDEGLDGYDAVNVSVPMPKLIDHTAIYVENGSYSLTPKNADGFSKVNVRVNVPNPQLTVLNATENGHYEAVDSGYYGYSAVEVNVPTPTFETSELVATENGIYRASEQGVDGFYAVMVDVNQTASKVVIPNGIKFAKSSAFDAELFDVSEIETMEGMFSDSFYLKSIDLSSWNNTSKVTKMNSLFDGCGQLSYINLTGIDTSKVVYMSSMFYNCQSVPELDLSSFNVSNVTSLSNLFYNCYSLASLKLNWRVEKVTLMHSMFYNCYKIPHIDLSNWTVSAVTDLSNLFHNCKLLTDIDIRNWNMRNVQSVLSLFYGCEVLTNLNMDGATLPKTDLDNWYLDTCTALTVESLVSVLNALPQSDGPSYICRIGSTNLAKLTDDQKAIATSKGWVLS